LVNSLTELLRISVGKDTVLNLSLAEELPVIEADNAQMQQLVLNLVTNASEAYESMPDATAVVQVSSGVMNVDAEFLEQALDHEYLEPGSYVYLEVADSGCGMKQALIDKIFEPFYSTKFEGRGLGMSAILGIVKGHHGLMKIDSEEGVGTTIRVCFPMSERQLKASNPKVEVVSENKGYVLIVDDEDVVRSTAKLLVESLGYSTLEACDGVQGVQVFEQHQHDIVVVLLDLTMPNMNGADCLDALREMQPDVSVVLSSGYAKDEVIQQLSNAEGVGFIQKPYSRAGLGDILKQYDGSSDKKVGES